jgi:hypothetical protein
MSRCAAQTWIGVLLVGLLAVGAAGSSGAAAPAAAPGSQVGKVPVCKVAKNGKERTKLVASHRVEKKLQGKYKLGECPNPANGRVMCKTRCGRDLKNVLVKEGKVRKKLGKGWTLGVCGPL